MTRFRSSAGDAVAALALRFGVSLLPDEGTVPGILHNLRTAVIDSSGRVVEMFSGADWTAAELLDALRRASA